MARSLFIGLLIYTAISAVANGHADPVDTVVSSFTANVDSGIINVSQTSSSSIQGTEKISSSSQSSSAQSSSNKNQSSSSQNSSSQIISNGSQNSSSHSSSAQNSSSENQSSSSQSSSFEASNSGSQSSTSQSSGSLTSASGNQSSSSQSNSAQSNSSASQSSSSQIRGSQNSSSGSQSSSNQSNSAQNSSSGSQSSSNQSSSGSKSSSSQSSVSQNSSSGGQSSSSQSSGSQNSSSGSQSSSSQNSSSQNNSNGSQSSSSQSSGSQNSSSGSQSSSSQNSSSGSQSSSNQSSGSHNSSGGSQSSSSQSSDSQNSSSGSQSSSNQSNSSQKNSSGSQSSNSQSSGSQNSSSGSQSSTSQNTNSNQSSKPKNGPKPLQCGPNEVVDECPALCGSERCPRSEKEANLRIKCAAPAKCPPPACKCRFNYKRDKNGKCIPTRDCPAFPCKGKNEEYNSCPPICPTDDCSQASPTGKCPLLGRIGIVLTCQPKCRCKKGYWRKNGVCVPYAECNIPNPLQCKANEEVKCVTGCPPQKTCSNRNQQFACPAVVLPCKNACVCKSGYVRNDKGDCVPEKQCGPPPLTCKVNEEEKCVASCPVEKTCQNRNHPMKYACPAKQTCKVKCVCKGGYLRNRQGVCVPEKECENGPKPLQCGPTEVIDKCPALCGSERCPRSEKEANLRIGCAAPDKCPPPACKCRFNYKRDKNGKCIPTRDCPAFPCKGKNEEYNSCPPICPTDDCSQASPDGKCPLLGRIGIVLTCQPTCRCKKGYWRKNGVCVPYAECNRPPPLTCKINEEERCVKSCPVERTCQNRYHPMKYACPAKQTCKNKCVCIGGYLRNRQGVCVPEKECEPSKCGPNEENVLSKSCPPDQCFSLVAKIRCNADEKEKYRCRCKPGFLRQKAGSPCVPICKCKELANSPDCTRPPPLTCKINEEERCVKSCPVERTCQNRYHPMKYACPAKQTCKNKCVCIGGYLRNRQGVCVPEKECGVKPLACRPHEVAKCVARCPPEKTCKNRNAVIFCPAALLPCENKCVCEPGYIRDDRGFCVPEKSCGPLKCKANEEQKCIDSCPPQKTCKNRNQTFFCTLEVRPCVNECVCKKGLIRNDRGDCVPENQCGSEPPKCDRNEEYVLAKSCPPDECFAVVADINCNPSETAQYRCRCKRDFLRKKAGGPCEPACNCKELANTPECAKPTKCGPNEERVLGKSCPPDTCISLVALFKCDSKEVDQYRCRCKPGYLRLEPGSPCVRTCKCPQLGGKCDKPEPKPEPKPKPLVCGPNEEEQCVNSCPPEKTCRLRVNIFLCVKDDNPCKRKCVCKQGYFRNSIGQCVSEAQCDRCSKPNEFYSCGGACDSECSTLHKQNRTNCPIINIKCNERCYCDDGHARDAAGNCVPISECKKPSCGRNEVNVFGKSCPPDTCLSLVAKFKCDSNEVSKNRCRCKPGYLRLKNGSPCVPKCQCPQIANSPECKTPRPNPKPMPLLCGPNEEERCVKPCPPEKTCRLRVNIFACVKDDNPCKRKCVCKPGYFRNSIGQCITEAQCDRCSKPNEFYSCGGACDSECSTLHKQNRTNCPIINIKCNERCYCDDGHARDAAGNCVPISECKKPNCGRNEVNVFGKSCPPDTCISLVAKFNCDSNEVSKNRCRCKPGYLRVKEGSPCVPICQCPEMANSPDCKKPTPKPLVCGPNEEDRCVKPCPRERTCKLRGIIELCRQDDNPCKNKCVCKPGFFRNSIGECISEAQCDRCSKPNEFFSCGGECDNVCSTINRQNRTNCPIINKKCNERCYCDDGYARNRAGACVPISQCSSTKPKNINQSSSQSTSSISIGKDGSQNSSQNSSSQASSSSVSKDTIQNSQSSSQNSSNQHSINNSQGKSQSSNQNSSQQNSSEKTTNNSQGISQASSQNSSQQSSAQQSASNSQGKSQSTAQNSSQQSSTQHSASNSQGNSQSSAQNSSQQSSTQQSASNSQGNSQSSAQNSSQQSSTQQSASNSQGNSQSSAQNSSQQSSTQQSASNSQGNSQSSAQKSSQQSSTQQSSSNSQGNSQSSAQNSSQQSSTRQSASNSQGTSQSSAQNSSQQSSTQQSASNSQGNSQSSAQNSSQQSSTQQSASNSQGNSQSSAQNSSQQSSTQQSASNSQGNSQSSAQKSSQQSSTQQSASNSLGSSQSSAESSNQESSSQQSTSSSQGNSQSSSKKSSSKKNSKKESSHSSKGSSSKTSSQQSSSKKSVSIKKSSSHSSSQSSSESSSSSSSSSSGSSSIGSGSLQCSKNEEYRCVQSCPPQRTCDNRKVQYMCPMVVKPCQNKCVCKKGYYRNALGTCITEAQCNKCSKPNEFFACDSACDNECRTIKTQGRKNCPIKNIVCNERCYCKDGFARDAKGNCVPECQCPQLAKSPKCKKSCH